MTTNVIDLVNGFVGTDSKWVMVDKDDPTRIYARVENSGYNKVVIAKKRLIFIFAGDGQLIEVWKKFLIKRCRGERARQPDFEIDGTDLSISLHVIDIENQTIIRRIIEGSGEQYTDDLLLTFAGSGAPYARDTWKATRNFHKSISYAVENDMYSGGEIKHFNLNKITENDYIRFKDTDSYFDLLAKFSVEGDGFEMYINGADKMLDKKKEQIKKDIETGKLRPVAYTNNYGKGYTDEQKEQIRKSMDELFETYF